MTWQLFLENLNLYIRVLFLKKFKRLKVFDLHNCNIYWIGKAENASYWFYFKK